MRNVSEIIYRAADWICTAQYTPAQFLIFIGCFGLAHLLVSAFIHKRPIWSVEYDGGRVVVDYTLRGKVVHGEAVHNH